MAVVATPAWNLPSGQHQIIRPLGSRSRDDTEGRTSPQFRRFYIVGTAGVCLAALALVVYPLAVFGYEVHRVVQTLLMVSMLAGAVVGTISFMTVLAVRTVDRLHARRLAALRAELGLDQAATVGRYAKLVELPEGIRTQVDRQGQAFAAIVTEMHHDLGRRLAEVERDRAELQNALRLQVATNQGLLDQLKAIEAGVGSVAGQLGELHRRVEVVEQQVDDLDGKMGNTATALGIIAAAESGSVRQLHPPNGSRRR